MNREGVIVAVSFTIATDTDRQNETKDLRGWWRRQQTARQWHGDSHFSFIYHHALLYSKFVFLFFFLGGGDKVKDASSPPPLSYPNNLSTTQPLSQPFFFSFLFFSSISHGEPSQATLMMLSPLLKLDIAWNAGSFWPLRSERFKDRDGGDSGEVFRLRLRSDPRDAGGLGTTGIGRVRFGEEFSTLTARPRARLPAGSSTGSGNTTGTESGAKRGNPLPLQALKEGVAGGRWCTGVTLSWWKTGVLTAELAAT